MHDHGRTFSAAYPLRAPWVFLVAALFQWGCESTVVSLVEVSEVGVNPTELTLLEGARGTLTALVTDQAGTQLSPRANVTWAVDDAEIVSVDQQGGVVALAAGITRVRATVGGVTGSAAVTVVPGPTLALSLSTVELRATAGDRDPITAEVDIRNAGNGALDQLSARVDGSSGTSTDWLGVELLGAAAPTRLRLEANPEGFGPGRYDARVVIESAVATGGPVALTVRLIVEAAEDRDDPDPEDPEIPHGPDDPEDPDDPDPEDPEAPDPEDPEDPQDPDDPDEPDPEDPEAPQGPDDPQDPDDPDEPDPENPDDSDDPDPEAPQDPEDPDDSEDPEDPEDDSDDDDSDDNESDDNESDDDSDDDDSDDDDSDDDDSDDDDSDDHDDSVDDDDPENPGPSCDIRNRIIFGNLEVPRGTSCTISNVRVLGDVRLDRGSRVNATQLRVDGKLEAKAADELVLVDSRILDDLKFEEGGRATILGTDVGDDLVLKKNRGELDVRDSDVGDDFTLEDNRDGPFTLFRNTIAGKLQCKGNAPAPTGDGNIAGKKKQGQCRGL